MKAKSDRTNPEIQSCNMSEIAATCANKLENKKGRNYLQIFNHFKISVFYMPSGGGQLIGASSLEESEIL